MLKSAVLLVLLAAAVAGAHAEQQRAPADTTKLTDDVRDRERAFARTMAERQHEAFVTFLADEAVFVGQQQVFRGKAAVAVGWKRLFEGPQAPFSWEPERVEVVESGTLALSSGPVRDPSGKRVGTFNSVWRREADGTWKIVLDNGCPPCDSR
ncbi:MAG TPA: nuclear transport factor 2 family protein [Vicinamibacterales bacterium]|nr:nuclear transport factor 2 family protein [Vicinamibacterales bacterium]